MSNRIAKRRHARDLRAKRRDLIHAAGCTEPNCCVRGAVFDSYHIVNEACADGVRIPRSVARRWADGRVEACAGGRGR